MSERAEPEIRLATFEDISAIQILDEVCHLNCWNAEVYKGLMTHHDCEVTVAALARSVSAFCAVRRTKPDLEILKIGVHPDWQGAGIGKALLDDALRRAKAVGCEECFLEVRWTNERAIGFYRREGFEMIGIRRQYYRNPVEDARVMRKRLVAEG